MESFPLIMLGGSLLCGLGGGARKPISLISHELADSGWMELNFRVPSSLTDARIDCDPSAEEYLQQKPEN